MAFELVAYQGRTRAYSYSLFLADGVTPLMLNPLDELRFKAGVLEAVPTLDFSSALASPNGSTITITSRGLAGVSPATYTIELVQADTVLFSQGTCDAEIVLVDTGDVNRSKTVDIGVLHVIGTMTGTLGL